MPGEGGGFATGLAKGLFGEISAQRDRKEKQKAEEKQQTLQLLTGLVDQAEPSSKPALLRHIGDVIGLKGPQKGIWGRITGADIESDRGALREKLAGVLGSLQGPEAYRQAAPKEGPTGMSVGYGGIPSFSGKGMTPDRRDPNAVYLRDPLESELEKIRTRSEAQASLAAQREAAIAQRQAALQEDRQAFTKQRDETLENYKIMQEVNTLVERQAIRKGRPATRQDYVDVIDDLEIARGLKLDKLRADTGLSRARTKLAEFEAQINPATGLPMGKTPNVQQDRMFGLAQERESRQRQQDASAMELRYNSARAAAIKLSGEVQAAYKRVEASPYYYKEGKLYNRSTNQELSPGEQMLFGGTNPTIGLNIQGLQKLEAAERAARDQLLQLRNTITGAFPDMFQGGDAEGWDLQKIAPQGGAGVTLQGATPLGANNRITGQPPQGKVGKVGETLTKSIAKENLMPGDIVTIDQGPTKGQYRVIKRVGESGPDGRTNYEVKKIR